MRVINLTGAHSVDVYAENQFINLQQLNATTWIADFAEGEALATYPPNERGEMARVETTVKEIESALPGIIVGTVYGNVTGIPYDVCEQDVLLVSLPTKTMAAFAKHNRVEQMASPYKVVRKRGETSTILGCMGLTF